MALTVSQEHIMALLAKLEKSKIYLTEYGNTNCTDSCVPPEEYFALQKDNAVMSFSQQILLVFLQWLSVLQYH